MTMATMETETAIDLSLSLSLFLSYFLSLVLLYYLRLSFLLFVAGLLCFRQTGIAAFLLPFSLSL